MALSNDAAQVLANDISKKLSQLPPDLSWNKRVAQQMADIALETEGKAITAGMIEALLEAAQEMKCVRLEVLLARCYEILEYANNNDERVETDDGFLKEILDACR